MVRVALPCCIPPPQVRKTSVEESLDEKRLLLRVSPDGKVVSAGGSPTALFGVERSSLAGRSVAELVDVLGEWAKQGACT